MLITGELKVSQVIHHLVRLLWLDHVLQRIASTAQMSEEVLRL